MSLVRYVWAPCPDVVTQRTPADITGVVIHRIEVSQEDATFGDTPAEVIRFFTKHPIGVRATGGEMPYPILIEGNGDITQTVPLARQTPHARAYNFSTIGVACIGDFRGPPAAEPAAVPTAPQWRGLVEVCAALLHRFELSIDALQAHDALAEGSKDPDKICPGEGLSLEKLRLDVQAALEQRPGLVDFALAWDSTAVS